MTTGYRIFSLHHAQLFDREVDDALNKVLDITLAPGVLQCDYAKFRVRLPARHTGAGIGSCGPADQGFSVKELAAFVGATSKVVSEILDRVSEDGYVMPVYSTGLAPLIGAGSFDGRWVVLDPRLRRLGSWCSVALVVGSAASWCGPTGTVCSV